MLWPLISLTKKSFLAFVRYCFLSSKTQRVCTESSNEFSNIPMVGKQGLGEKMCGRREALRERLGSYGVRDLI